MNDFYNNKTLSNFRKSDFLFLKSWREEDYEYNNKRFHILCKRSSYYNSYIKDRTFNRYMVQGLCFGKFYGVYKIKNIREESLPFYKQLKNKRNYFRRIN